MRSFLFFPSGVSSALGSTIWRLVVLATVGLMTRTDAPAQTDAASRWHRWGSLVAQRFSIDVTGMNGRPHVIRQLADRRIAVGSDRALHLYDGQRWQEVAGFSGVHSIEPLPDGRFFIGSGSEIFGFSPDGRGEFTTRPLTRGLLRDRPDSIVSSLAHVGETLYGLDGPRLIAIPESGDPYLIPLPTWCTEVFAMGGQLYVRPDSIDHGLLRYEPAERTWASASHLVPSTVRGRIAAQSTDADGRVWFVADDGQVFRSDGESTETLYRIPSPEGAKVEIHTLQALPGDQLAAATVDQGVLILNSKGELLAGTAEDPAVPRGRVYALSTDFEGGLWLGAALELTRLDGYLTGRSFGETEGVNGEAWAIVRHQGLLYVGTDAGLFVENRDATTRAEAFVHVPGVSHAKALVDTPEGLWIASTHVLLLSPNGALHDFGNVTADPNPLLRPRGHPDVMLAGVRSGLAVIRRQGGTWLFQGVIPGTERPIFSIAETTGGDVWASFGTGSIARVRLRGPKGVEARTVGEAEGIPNRWVQFGALGANLYMGGDRQTLKWDDAQGRFVPTTEIIYYGIDEPIGFDPVFSNDEDVWTWPQTTVGTLVPRPPPETLALMATVTGHFRARGRCLWRDEGGVYWIGLPRGVVRYAAQPAEAGEAERAPSLLLRRLVDLRTGQSLLGGLSVPREITLPHRRNSVRVEAALPRFGAERFAQFSMAMTGFDEAPPPHRLEASREFFNLPAGRYQLRITAHDATGRAALPVELAVHVLAPWYATRWAYLGYALGAVILVAGVVRWRVAHLDRRAAELQRAVEERTVEISRQSALLQEEKELFMSLASAAPVGIWRGEADGSIILVNAALERITGRSRGRLLQEGWLQSVHPEDRETARELMRSCTHEQGTISAELRFERPEGEVRWVIVGIAPVRTGQEWAVWLVGTALDVTERREVERRMMRAQRLESIGTLTGGIAHDLNNALVPIVAGVSLLEDDTAPDRRTLLSDIERSAKRAASMVRQLLAFARGMDGQRVPVDLVSLLAELRRLLERTFPKNVAQHYDLPNTPAWTKGDPTQLHQVLLNLCLNARDAMAHGGTLQVHVSTVRVERALDAFQEPIPSGEYRVIRVQDTGSGMPAKVLEHIFDPFFTTKEPDRGTGLGLSTSLGIIRSHGGFIAVDTQVGVGTTFSIFLPAVSAPTDAAPPPANAPQPGAMKESVLALVVDDEVAIRTVVQRSFERMKLRAVTAADGREGLRRWSELRHEIGLLAVDLHMPEMDGVTLVRAVRAQNTEVPIIVFSGNLSEDQRTELHGLNVRWVLHKPFRYDDLAAAVRSALS